MQAQRSTGVRLIDGVIGVNPYDEELSRILIEYNSRARPARTHRDYLDRMKQIKHALYICYGNKGLGILKELIEDES